VGQKTGVLAHGKVVWAHTVPWEKSPEPESPQAGSSGGKKRQGVPWENQTQEKLGGVGGGRAGSGPADPKKGVLEAPLERLGTKKRRTYRTKENVKRKVPSDLRNNPQSSKRKTCPSWESRNHKISEKRTN